MGIEWGYSGTLWDSMGEYIDHVGLSEKLTFYCSTEIQRDIILDIKGYSVVRYKGMYQQEHTYIYIYT